ncbi:MAG TPA: prenyltransferase [Dehalococcoidia bacterium]|nr:prenyltransferase [Dehalococcoidia bacterium]
MAATGAVSLPRLWWQAIYTVPQVDLSRADPVTRWLVLSRAAVVVMTVTSAAIGGLLAALDGVFDGPRFVLALAGLVLAHLGSNLANDLGDYLRGIDAPDSPRALYGPHGLAHGTASLRRFALATALVLAGAAAIGVWLVVLAGPWVLAFALGGAFVLLFYSGLPWSLKYVGLGEPSVLLVWGPLMVGGTYYVMAESVPAHVWVASLPYGLAVTAVLMGKHIDKLDFDAARQVWTLPRLLGEGRARRLTQALMVGGYLAALAVAIWQVLPGMLLCVLALPVARRVLAVLGRPKPLQPRRPVPGWPLWFVNFAFYHTRQFGALLVLGLALQLAVERLVDAL